MTRAFLDLIDTLTDNTSAASIASLGTGSRSPGFDPYLNFIRDSVFLKFHTRTYKNAAEKWEVSAGCLAIFKKLLDGYDPAVGDFGTGSSAAAAAATVGRHPGFHMMVNLLQSSETLRMILFILDEGCTLLDTYTEFPGKKALERSCLLCLQVNMRD